MEKLGMFLYLIITLTHFYAQDLSFEETGGTTGISLSLII